MAAAVIKCPAPWLGWKSPEAELGAELGANTQPSSAVPGEAGLMGDRGQQLRSFTGGLLGGLRRHRWLLGRGRGPQRGRRIPAPGTRLPQDGGRERLIPSPSPSAVGAGGSPTLSGCAARPLWGGHWRDQSISASSPVNLGPTWLQAPRPRPRCQLCRTSVGVGPGEVMRRGDATTEAAGALQAWERNGPLLGKAAEAQGASKATWKLAAPSRYWLHGYPGRRLQGRPRGQAPWCQVVGKIK